MRLFAAALAAPLLAGPLLAQTVPAPSLPGPSAAPAAPQPRANLNATIETLIPGSPPATAAPQQRPNPQQRRAEMEQRFDAANTTRDGRLTLAQARAAQITQVVRNFQAIDRGNKGYVTKADIETYMRSRQPQKAPN
ncbi:MAG: hypothetical protein NT133_24300 [Alphaproteobacteria bacterium]|nr:hypothetical protein [Alphaproteobacteria bacterium]